MAAGPTAAPIHVFHPSAIMDKDDHTHHTRRKRMTRSRSRREWAHDHRQARDTHVHVHGKHKLKSIALGIARTTHHRHHTHHHRKKKHTNDASENGEQVSTVGSAASHHGMSRFRAAARRVSVTNMFIRRNDRTDNSGAGSA